MRGEPTAGDGRPAVHLTAATGWINDPLGLTWRGDRYHLFFQHVPGATVWSPRQHWGHATSTDLLHWTEQPIALAPGEGDDGVWSGSIAVDEQGATHLFYTSVVEPELRTGRVRVARPSDDDWIGWREGPVVAEPPAGIDVVTFRDPFVFRDAEVWRMLVGAELPGHVAAALSYSSPDLEHWTYDGVAAERPATEDQPARTGAMWECPQLFEVDGSHVLVVSVWEEEVLHSVAYGVGQWSDGRFTARTWRRLTYGDSYYAPSLFRDREGRPGLIFWLRGAVAEDGTTWSGALSVPYLVGLEGDVLTPRLHPDHAEALDHVPASDDGRLVARRPTVVRWDARAQERLLIARPARPDIVMDRTVEGMTVHDGVGGSHLLPSRDLLATVLVDHGIVEIISDSGLLAVP